MLVANSVYYLRYWKAKDISEGRSGNVLTEPEGNFSSIALGIYLAQSTAALLLFNDLPNWPIKLNRAWYRGVELIASKTYLGP